MGQYLSQPVTKKESASGQNDTLAYGMSSMQGWRVSMEDDHVNTLDVGDGKTSLFAVFDGHGGRAVAQYTALHLTDILVKTEAFERKEFGLALAESFYKIDELLDTEDAVQELRMLAGATKKTSNKGGLFSKMEDQLQPEDGDSDHMKRADSSKEFVQSALTRHSIVDPAATEKIGDLETKVVEYESDDEDMTEHRATGMGCTAVAAIIHGTQVVVANTGDSRCVLSRKGEAQPLTLDHKPVLVDEAERIVKAGGFVRDNRVNGALNVSRTIGDLDFKRNTDLPHTHQMVIATPDIVDFELNKGDEFLILACDGIWDVLTNQEAVDFVRKRIKQGMPLKLICEEMCDHCLAPDLKGLCRGADNMSVIIVLFKQYAEIIGFWGRLLNTLKLSSC